MTNIPVINTVVPSRAKTWIGVAGAILAVVIPLVVSVQQYLPPPWASVIGAIIVILTGLGIYHAPYQPPETTIVRNEDIAAINAGQAVVPGPTRPYQTPWGQGA